MKTVAQGMMSLLLTMASALAQQYVISTVAGGAPIPTPIAATSASVGQTVGVAVGPAGEVYFTGYGHSVYRIDALGVLTRVAGNGRYGFSGDGGPAVSALLDEPRGVVVDAAGALYIADNYNHRIRKIATNGIITTVAGNGSPGYSGDGGSATSAQLAYPTGVAVDAAGNLYVGCVVIKPTTTSGLCRW
jgi:sugar lactone lactonase YvrE